MSSTTPKSLIETIGLEELRKKVVDEIGLPEIIPKSLTVPLPFNISTFQPLVSSIEGFAIKCEDTTTFIYKDNPLFKKYLSDYVKIQLRIKLILENERSIFYKALHHTHAFNHIKNLLTTRGALGPVWLEHAIPRPLIHAYGYTTYFLSNNPKYDAIVRNYEQILRWIYNNALDIAPKLTNRLIVEDYINRFDYEAILLKRRGFSQKKESSAEIHYNYLIDKFIRSKPLNIPVLHHYIRRYDNSLSDKPSPKRYTRRAAPETQLPVLSTSIPVPTGKPKLTRIITPSTGQTILPSITINTPRPIRARNTRRIRSPIINRPIQVFPGWRPPSPYFSPPTPPNSDPNSSANSANSFVTARGN